MQAFRAISPQVNAWYRNNNCRTHTLYDNTLAFNSHMSRFEKNNHRPADSWMSEETLRRELRSVRAQRRSIAGKKSDWRTGMVLALCLSSLGGLYYRYWPTQEQAIEQIAEVQPAAMVLGIQTPKASTHSKVPSRMQANAPVQRHRKSNSSPCPTDVILPNAYAPNLLLEQLSGTMKCSNHLIQTKYPAPDTLYARRDCMVQIPFEGTVDVGQGVLNLAVYSNQSDNYKKEKPVYEEPLLLEKTGKSQRYALKPLMALPPGLYYFVIENKNEQTLAVGKFKVG